MSEIVTDLHAMNKMVINQLPKLEDEKLSKLRMAIKYLVEATDIKYLMLLSNEKRDYTVFNIQEKSRQEAGEKFSNEVFECLENRGDIKEFDIKEDANAIEIWVGDTFYALFPYDLGVIEI